MTRRADLPALLDDFNRSTSRARTAYDACPDACAQLFGTTCHNCTHDKHNSCSGRAYHDGNRVPCACHLDDHRINDL